MTPLLLLVASSACGEPFPEPPAGRLDTADAREHGRAIYVEHCALCHGANGDGRGERRHALSGPPADFSSPAWRQVTTPGEVFVKVRDGVRGTSMPAWRTLDEDETWDVVAYLWSVGEGHARGSRSGAPGQRDAAR